MISQLITTPEEAGKYEAHGNLDAVNASVSIGLSGARIYATLGIATLGFSAEAAHELGKHLIAAAQAMLPQQAGDEGGAL